MRNIMKWEIEMKEDILEKKNLELSKVILFGSRAGDSHSEESDLDIREGFTC